MKVLLLLTLAAFGQCALLGSDKCTYGPSYWCSHIRHAKECSAMQHCMDTVWKNQRMDMIGSTETCFDVIKVLDVVRHTSDEDFMEQWAVGCTGLPAEKRQLCKDLIGTNMKEVSMLLKSDLSSRQIAAALKLCGGFVDTVPRPRQVQVTGDYCKDCVNFFGDLREIFNNSEAQAESMLKSLVCSKAGPLESLCDQLVDQYAQILYNIIYQQINPQDVCQVLQMCANQTHADLMKSVKYMLAQRQRSSALCDVCQTITKDLKEALQDKDIQTALTSALENGVCPLLGSFAAQCKTYVADYAPLVFQLAVSEMDTLCQTLGLCNATKSDHSKLTHVPLASPVGAVQILAPEKETNSVDCYLCKFLVKELKEVIDGKTVEEAEKFLEKLCNDLPDSISGTCIEFVKEYGSKIVQLVLSEMDPETVCELVKECPDAKRMPAVKLGTAVKNSVKCEVCMEVMELVQQELNSSQAKTLEKEVLEKICAILPSSERGICDLFVTEYYPAIANLILEEVDPAKLCTLVDLCGQTVKPEESHALKFQPMMALRPAARHYVLGTNKCVFGPSFWCASPENMRLCQAEEHCKKMKKNNTEE